jgi:type II secretory pathway pseudopilin PulG
MNIGQIKKNQNGFTLLEALVVIGIMVTMTLLTFLGNRNLHSGRNIEMSAFRLSSEIRKMQGYTLNLQDYSGHFPEGGWGINLKSGLGTYKTFADIGLLPDHRMAALGELYQEIALPDQATISSVKARSDQTDPYSEISTDVYLAFEPPDPLVHICDNAVCDYVEMVVEIQNTSGTSKKYVYANKFGLIEVLKQSP